MVAGSNGYLRRQNSGKYHESENSLKIKLNRKSKLESNTTRNGLN